MAIRNWAENYKFCVWDILIGTKYRFLAIIWSVIIIMILVI